MLRTRRYIAAGNQGNAFLEAREAQKHHAGGSAELWRKVRCIDKRYPPYTLLLGCC